MTGRHELFDELEAFDSKWRLKFATVYEAAKAAQLLDLYGQYLLQKRSENEREALAGESAVWNR